VSRTIPVVIVAGIVAALIITRAKAESEPTCPTCPPCPDITVIPTIDDILASTNFYTLNAYYDQLSLLYINQSITDEEYSTLYAAYEQRFYEIWEEL